MPQRDGLCGGLPTRKWCQRAPAPHAAALMVAPITAGTSEDADDRLVAATGLRLVARARSEQLPELRVPQDGWGSLRESRRLPGEQVGHE